MLEVLSTNRDLTIDLKETETMLRVEIEQLPSYEIGLEKGMEKQQAVIIRDLLSRYSAEQVAEILQMDIALVRQLAAPDNQH